MGKEQIRDISLRAKRVFVSALPFLVAGCLFVQPARAGGGRVLLDSESMECVRCHEGTVDMGMGMVMHRGGSSHPVGMDYIELASKRPGLKDPSALEPGIKLVDGKIGCITCHVPYSRDDHELLSGKRKEVPKIPDPMLSVDNRGSRLCLACHDK